MRSQVIKRGAAGLLAVLALAWGARAQDAGPGYQPTDKDERGLWMRFDEQESQLKTSGFVIRDPALNDYVRRVFCRTVGPDACKTFRIYIVRTPYFNSSMAPNGMLEVTTGLLLRVHNEAQLAAVLGHEYTHYKKKHSLRLFRSAKNNSTAESVLLLGGIAGGLAALAVFASTFEYSRDMEREADSGGLALMAAAGYDPTAAAAIWEQQRQEQETTAAARNMKPRYHDGGIFATHPNSLERMTALRAQAATLPTPGGVLDEAAYRQALASWWPQFFDDQLKLNDFGGGEFLLAQLASTGWTPELLYARGELYRTRGRPEDLDQAADFFRQAVQSPGAPAEAWRGLGLALLRRGDRSNGQAALKTYVQKRPDAPDRAMMVMLAGGLS